MESLLFKQFCYLIVLLKLNSLKKQKIKKYYNQMKCDIFSSANISNTLNNALKQLQTINYLIFAHRSTYESLSEVVTATARRNYQCPSNELISYQLTLFDCMPLYQHGHRGHN